MDEVQKQYFIEILKKYRRGNATKEEMRFLESYYDVFELTEDLINDENEESYLGLKKALKESIDHEIDLYQKKSVLRPMSAWVKYAVAASVLVFLSATVFLLLKPHKQQNTITNIYKGIAPGANRATLTLSNGTRILLDDTSKGEIARQSGVVITKTDKGLIVYKIVPGNATAQSSAGSQLNTVSTPRGGQYQIILPDGSKVWLNAASSLSYPTSFKGAERLVVLDGEAYFEVAKNKSMPFRVKSGIQIIEVLGTHFNVNGYSDESNIKTTLLEGSVKVSTGADYKIIAPGEQAVVSKATDGPISKHSVNLDKETAWKNGIFSFENDDLKSIMRQVCRWYNIDAEYIGKLPDERYSGEISRNSNLADVFKILELNNIKFDVEGKTVKVSQGDK